MRSGVDLVQRSVLERVLESFGGRGIQWHAMRTRHAGARRFVSLHLLVPAAWTVQRGADLLEEVEHNIRAALGTVTVFTHLEPVEDPLAWEDVGLDRATDGQARTTTESRQPGEPGSGPLAGLSRTGSWLDTCDLLPSKASPGCPPLLAPSAVSSGPALVSSSMRSAIEAVYGPHVAPGSG